MKGKLVKHSGSLRKSKRKKKVGAHHEPSHGRSQLQVAARRTNTFDLQSGRVVIVLSAVREFGLCVNFALGRLDRLMGKGFRLYITRLWGFLVAFARTAAGASKGPKVGFLLGRNCRFEIHIGRGVESVESVTRRGVVRRAAWGFELKLKMSRRGNRHAAWRASRRGV